MKARSVVLFASLGCALYLVTCAPAQGADAGDGDAKGATSRPAEIRRGLDMSGSREERSRRVFEQAIRKVEPSLVGKPERLPQYIELFKREFVEDPRTFAFNVTATQEMRGGAAADPLVRLTGWVEFDEHRKSLREFLGYLGFKNVADDTLDVLPGPALCESAYAIVTGESCFVYDRPAGALRETLTEALPGEALFLLKDVGGGMFLCHAPDGYVGYVEAAKVKWVDADAFDEHLRSRRRSREADARVDTAIAAATKLIGTKYVWGGRTSAGIDCSGLVHTSFRAAGISMPRDTDQQSLVGTLVATRWHKSSLRRGDVMFFLGRRGTISHTGIYLGEGKFIEATDPVVKITALDEIAPGKEHRRDESFCFAKRVFE